jgi:hypothetical protein
MALLRRELCRQIEGPEVTHADCCALVFGTDAKTLYVEREVAHVDDVHDGMRMDGFRSAPTGSGSGSSYVVSAARELFRVYPRQPTWQTLDMGC